MDEHPEELICIPGQRICPLTEETISGEGTYERADYIYSNLAGVLKFRKSEKVFIKKSVYLRIIIN